MASTTGVSKTKKKKSIANYKSVEGPHFFYFFIIKFRV